MKLEALMVSNAANADEGVLHVNGGGWEFVRAPLLPTSVQGAIAGVVSMAPSESTEPIRLDIRIDSGESSPALAIGGAILRFDRPAPAGGVDYRQPFALPFVFVVEEPVTIRVTVSSQDVELGSLSFAVLDPIPNTAAM